MFCCVSQMLYYYDYLFNLFPGDLEGDEVADRVIDVLFNVSKEMRECQWPKPVLLPTGEVILIINNNNYYYVRKK